MITEATKRLDIQLLRAIAVIMVILFHLGLLSQSGYLGVDVFFVVSGFVITNSLLRRTGNPNSLSDASSFLVRRAKRLLPALFWMVVISTTIASVFLSPFDILPTGIATGFAALLGTGNIAIALSSGDYFALSAERNLFLHTWSLGVEEQFYLFVAILLLLGGGVAFLRRRSAFVFFTTLFLVSLVAFSVGTAGLAIEGWQTLFGFYSPVSRAWELTAGVLLALYFYHTRDERTPKKSLVVRRYLAWAGFLFIVSVSLLPLSDETARGPLTFLVVSSTALIIWAGIDNDHLRLPVFKPLIKIGDLSYSAYLWHWPAILFTRELLPDFEFSILVALFALITATLISGRWLEFPFSRTSGLVQRFQRARFASAATASVAIAIGATIATFNVAYPASPLARDIGLKEVIPCATIDDFRHPCEILHGVEGRLLVVGDSTALPFFAGASQYAASKNYSLTFSSKGGCPATRPGARYPREESCVSWQESVSEHLRSHRPDEIWLINRSGAYTNPDLGFYGIVSENGALLRSSEDLVAEWYASIKFLLKASPASSFVVFQSHPEPPKEKDHRTLFNAMLGWYPEPVDGFARASSHEARLNSYRAQEFLRSRIVRVIDPYEALCTPMDCNYTSSNGQEIYWDNSHLSPSGANQVLAHFGFLP